MVLERDRPAWGPRWLMVSSEEEDPVDCFALRGPSFSGLGCGNLSWGVVSGRCWDSASASNWEISASLSSAVEMRFPIHSLAFHVSCGEYESPLEVLLKVGLDTVLALGLCLGRG